MLRVEMSDAKGSLSDYARKARKQPVVVTRRGRPVAALMALSEDDWEDFVVARHPGFPARVLNGGGERTGLPEPPIFLHRRPLRASSSAARARQERSRADAREAGD